MNTSSTIVHIRFYLLDINMVTVSLYSGGALFI